MTGPARRLLRLFANMKMKRKVILTYVLLSILPIAGLNLFTYRYTRNILLERERNLAMDAIRQAALQVDYQLEIYDALSNYIFNDANILSAVNDQYGEQYFKMYKAYADSLEPPFQTYYALHPDLVGITIFTGSDLAPLGSYVRPLRRLEEQEWFSRVREQYQPVWLVTQQDGESRLCSVRKMAYRGGDSYDNYLYLELDYGSFFSPLCSISAGGYGLAVVDGTGELLFISDTLAEPVDPRRLQGEQGPAALDPDYMVLQTGINGGQWTVHYYRPLSQVTRSVTGFIQAVFLFLWLVLAIVGVLAWIFSGVIVSPLEALTQNMQQVQKGDMQVTVQTTRSDEVGILIQSFRDMIEQIQNLIQVVYKNEIEKKEYQLTILRAQINPHFLYNALSLINSKAILAGQEEISRMALLITSFYRTALNHGRDTTTVENELNNTRSYISIQLLLCTNAFAVDYDLAQEALACPMPNFILQPIVENAIGHGLMNDAKEDKLLTVRVRLLGEQILLEVEDNGAGMSQDQVGRLLLGHTDSYGLKNVHERLQLLYDSAFGFQVDSEPGRGTRVSLRIPRQMGKNSRHLIGSAD